MKKLLLLLALSFGISIASYAQRQVTGTVSGENNEPLVGASVEVEGANVGTITDFDGNFSIEVPDGSNVLLVSYLGYAEQRVEIGNLDNVFVSLVPGGIALDDVVVVGYAEQEKRFSTQSVSTLSSESFKDWPALSPQQLLQGQVAGVQMVNSSGVLGANANVRVRGATSITAGAQPLYVVDGVPLNDNSMSFAQGGGTSLNPLQNINPNDIESMSVLKDASAVAIYGSRGANGVILITTKKGRKGQKTAINVDMFTGWSEPTNLEAMMNTEQFTTFRNDLQRAQGQPETDYSGVRDSYFDWPGAVTRTGRQNSVNISARGGDERTTFSVVGNFLRQEGFTIGNEADRFSGRFNFEHRANDLVTVGANVSASTIFMNRIGVENNTAAPLTSSYLQLPFVQPFDENGAYVNTGFIQNVLAREDLNINDHTSRRLTGNIFAELNLAKGLTFRTDWGMDNFGTSEKGRTVDLFTPGGSAYRTQWTDNKWMSTNTLNYNTQVGKSDLNFLAGYSYETSRLEILEAAGTGFASDGLPNVASAANPTSAFESGTEWALESQFLRANYRYDNKYMLEASVRRDGSSRFGANNKYGTFWAVGGGWILSEESFLVDNDFINFMKLTASYGTAGNDRIGNFTHLALYGGGAAADYAGLAGLRPTQVPNPDLTWEETAQLDIGLNIQFYRNIFNVQMNYYDKITTGNLLSVPLPFTTGFAGAQANVGSVQNRGFEFDFSALLVNKADFQWSLGFNVAFNENTVLELPDDSPVDEFGNKFIGGSVAQRAVEGMSINEFYVVRHQGVNPQTGDFEWLDLDGNPTNIYDPSNNRQYVGSAIPQFIGGINTTIAYKGFDATFLFNFTYGNLVLIDGLRFTENMVAPGFNKSVALLDYWQEVGDEAFAPSLASPTVNSFNQLSTLQVQNGSFLRLRNVNVGYTLPPRLLSGQNAIRSLRIYALAQNLWLWNDSTFRGPDPEVSANGPNTQVQGQSFFALPQPYSLQIGVNVGF